MIQQFLVIVLVVAATIYLVKKLTGDFFTSKKSEGCDHCGVTEKEKKNKLLIKK